MKDADVKYFFTQKQPRCPYKRLMPAIINDYTVKVIVCSRTNARCLIKNCPDYGK